VLLLDGLELEPDAALPDALPLAPPLAWSFFVSLELDAEPDIEPDGEAVEELGDDGEVVEPADEELEPDGEVVVPREAARSPLRSQALNSAVPNATDTASARVVNLMCMPPWLGYLMETARNGPICRRS
jgi:hypothetical protein